jgi:hypothetical protein
LIENLSLGDLRKCAMCLNDSSLKKKSTIIILFAHNKTKSIRIKGVKLFIEHHTLFCFVFLGF